MGGQFAATVLPKRRFFISATPSFCLNGVPRPVFVETRRAAIFASGSKPKQFSRCRHNFVLRNVHTRYGQNTCKNVSKHKYRILRQF